MFAVAIVVLTSVTLGAVLASPEADPPLAIMLGALGLGAGLFTLADWFGRRGER